MNDKLKSKLGQVLIFLLFNSFIIYGIITGYFLVTSDAILSFYMAIIVFNILLITSVLWNRNVISLYIRSFQIFLWLTLIIITRDLISMIFGISSILLILFTIYIDKIDGSWSRLISHIAVMIFMASIGKMYTFLYQPVPAVLTIEYLPDKMVAIGLPTPITEAFGLFITTSYSDILLGPLVFFIILTASSLLVENYHLIIPLYLKSFRGQKKLKSGLVAGGYGIVAAMSCQCESAIALLPAVAVLLLNTLLIPFFTLSVVLLLFTYIFIKKYYSIGKVNKLVDITFEKYEIPLAIAILLVLQAILPFAILTKIYENIVIFFLYGMGMILSGYAFGEPMRRIVKFKFHNYLSYALLSISLFLVLIWYIPSLTDLAYLNPLIYSLMSYSMFISGLLIGIIYTSNDPHIGIFSMEIFSVAVGLIPIIIYYMTFTEGIKIWEFWNITDQMLISLVMWIIMLPVMWYITQKSLSLAGKQNFGDFIFYKP